MTLPPPPDRWTIELANREREEAIAAFGFTERQAGFLLQVLLHSGVFLERQYCRFAGTVHGQKSTDFITDPCRPPVSDGDHDWETPPGPDVPRPLQATVGGDRRTRQPF